MSRVKYIQCADGWRYEMTANGTTSKGFGFETVELARRGAKEMRKELSKIARANFKYRKVLTK